MMKRRLSQQRQPILLLLLVNVLKLTVLLCAVVWCRMVHWSVQKSHAVVDQYYFSSQNCLLPQHTFIHVANHERVTTNQSILILPLTISSTTKKCLKLRRTFWEEGYSVQSPVALELERHQSNCTNYFPTATLHLDNDYGFGSHLYLWSQALCNAMQERQKLQTYNPHWLWKDQRYCNDNSESSSPFACYFIKMEHRCQEKNNDDQTQQRQLYSFNNNNVTDPRDRHKRCHRLRHADPTTVREFRAASMEYIFQQLSPIVIQEAERQLRLLFGNTAIPNDLITVHIRWGDKFWEMDLCSIEEYLEAVTQHLVSMGRHGKNSTANIYLATEDPKAALEFVEKAPRTWNIHVDRTIVELDRFRPQRGNRASWTTRNTHGRAGLVALGSLLVALEADYFVLTTSSNWSRLMDMLRTNVVDRFCDNCTRMIDLRPGQW